MRAHVPTRRDVWLTERYNRSSRKWSLRLRLQNLFSSSGHLAFTTGGFAQAWHPIQMEIIILLRLILHQVFRDFLNFILGTVQPCLTPLVSGQHTGYHIFLNIKCHLCQTCQAWRRVSSLLLHFPMCLLNRKYRAIVVYKFLIKKYMYWVKAFRLT